MIPDLTDELVCRLGIKDVTTTEAYRNYWFEFFVQRIKGNKVMALDEYVLNQVVANTEFIDMDDNDQAAEIYLNTNTYNIRKNAEDQGVPFEKILMSIYHKDNAQDAMEAMTNKCISEAKRYYVAKFYAQENNVEFTDEESRNVIRNTAEHYKIPYEELVKQMPVELETMDHYKRYYTSSINDYYKDKFKVSLVK